MFIIDSPISDSFLNFSSILLDTERFPDGFRFLKHGQKVSFELVETPNSTDQSPSSTKPANSCQHFSIKNEKLDDILKMSMPNNLPDFHYWKVLFYVVKYSF
ncbi:hypothetical protein AN957_23640 [Cytobacillus solani]|uniref:Uncharacterized protein n=1 Tax=Cytobacillus solani TaxID=1637975 RepID=A0A0Q3TDN8_9BACI|nr:hypothetical protein AN957_23640 [Cytobacillus solani]